MKYVWVVKWVVSSGPILACKLVEVFRQELGHAEPSDFVLSKDLGHFFVRGEILLVFGVLQLVLFYVGPQLLNNYASGSVRQADNGSQIRRQSVALGKSFTLWHPDYPIKVFPGSIILEEEYVRTYRNLAK